jgi:hypothetical protein
MYSPRRGLRSSLKYYGEKYYGEYRALARVQGRTIAFGGSWTLRIPKPQALKKP